MLFRVLRTAKATLTKTFYLDEVGTDPSGSVAVRVERLDGTLVQAGDAVGPDSEHGFAFTFNGSDDLDELVVEWSATVGGDAVVLDQDTIEVVGGFFVGLGEIRDIDLKFKDATRFPTAKLIKARTWVEDEFERICGQAFVPRFSRETLPGNGSRALVLGRPLLRRVRAVSVGDDVFGQDVVDGYGVDKLGLLRREALWPVGAGNITVEYEHGRDRVPPGISEVALLRIKSRLLTSTSPLPDRAERIQTTEVGTVTLAIATPEKTGIPEVDAELGRWPSPRPGFG